MSFAAPVVVSAAMVAGWSWVAARMGGDRTFNFGQLRDRIHTYPKSDTEGIAKL